nr:hypothetical protein [Tanacetum cinerariifolium]
NSTLPALHDDLILSVIKQLKTQVVNCTMINQDKKHVNELLTAELERYINKERVLNELQHDEKASTSYESSQEIKSLKHTLSEHLKEKESLEQKITIRKNDFQKEEFRNIDRELALEKQLKPKLYDGRVIEKSDAVVIPDTEETLMLAEESRSKMIEKQNNPQMTEKKVITKPINYAILNQISTDFETRFVLQIEFSAEQAFWSQYSVQTDEPTLSATTTIVEVPKELPKVSMQMELAVEQHREEKHKFQNKMENVLQENNRILTQALSVKIVNVVVHDNVKSDCLNVDVCAHCVTIESKVIKDFIKKECYETLLQQYHTLKKHCISLEVHNQLKKEIFQKNTLSSLETAPTFAEFFEINELKTHAQAKDTVILQLKEKLHSLKVAENKHLKQTYKQLYDSIKSSRFRSKEQCDDLINKVNLKSAKVSDLNASLQEKVLVDVSPLVPKLRKNRTAHTDYIRHTLDEAATLKEIVESERLLSPLNTSLDYALVVTPKYKTKQIRPTEQITKSGKTTVTTPPSANLDSNTPVLSSTRVILVSSASRSMSQDNTKKNRIRRTQRKAKKNKIEDHLRTVKSGLYKKSVVDSKATSSVINYVSNVNSNLKCASCNGCLFSDNHDACVVAYIKSVNARIKSKSVKTPV